MYSYPPPTLYAAWHCACHSCLPATPPLLKTKRCSLASSASPLPACSLARVVSAGQSQHLPPTIHSIHSIHSILPTRLIPTSPSPSTCPSPSTPIPSIRHRRIATPTPATLRAKPSIPIRLKPRLPLQGVALHLRSPRIHLVAAAVCLHPYCAARDQPREPSPPPDHRYHHPRSFDRPADGTLVARPAPPEHIIVTRCTTRARRLAWMARRAIINPPCKLLHAHTRPPNSTSETAPAPTTACRSLPTTIATIRHPHRPADQPDPCRHLDAIAPPRVTTTQ